MTNEVIEDLLQEYGRIEQDPNPNQESSRYFYTIFFNDEAMEAKAHGVINSMNRE